MERFCKGLRDHAMKIINCEEKEMIMFTNCSYKIPKEIPVVFHNGSTYDYRFIINKLAKELYGQLECLGENTEKYISFSVPISKELDNGKTITYRLKFIDSLKFMSTSLAS